MCCEERGGSYTPAARAVYTEPKLVSCSLLYQLASQEVSASNWTDWFLQLVQLHGSKEIPLELKFIHVDDYLHLPLYSALVICLFSWA